MKYQIRKMNDLNWQVWEWQEGGTVSRGRYVGQEKQAKYVPMESYHGTIGSAVKWMLEHAIRANVESATELDTAAILAAVEQARTDVLDAVSRIEKE